MFMSTKVRKLQNRAVLAVFSKGTIRYKLKYLIQSNELYIVEDLKKIQYTGNEKQRVNQIQLSVKVKYKTEKTKQEDTILIVQFMKTGSKLDDNLMELGNQLQALFNAELMSKKNEIGFVEYRLFYKMSKNKERVNLSDKVEYQPKGHIVLNRYYNWDYIDKPHMLIGGESGSGKSRLTYSVIQKMMSETSLENIYICDAKYEGLKNVANETFNLPMVAQNQSQIINFIEIVAEISEQRNDSKKSEDVSEFMPVFLVIDEFKGLKLGMEDKKEWIRLNNLVESIVLMGRSANVHVLIAMQRVKGDSISLDIRDNLAIKVGLGNLSDENFKMIFGESKVKGELLNREKGQGYISLNSSQLLLFDSPFVSMK